MSKRHSVAVALAASTGFLVAFAGASMAGSGHARGPGLFAKLDPDGDGKISVVDVEADAARRAAEIDANRDGSVTTLELKAWREQQREKRVAERLARLDSNSDGKVSVDEFANAQSARIARLDTDGDGAISHEEARAGRHGHRRQRGERAE